MTSRERKYPEDPQVAERVRAWMDQMDEAYNDGLQDAIKCIERYFIAGHTIVKWSIKRRNN